MILLEYENIKFFLRKVTLQIDLKKIFVIKRVKNTAPWAYVINDLNGEEIGGTLYENKFQKMN